MQRSHLQKMRDSTFLKKGRCSCKDKLFEKEGHEYNPELSPSVWTKYLRVNVAIKVGLRFYYVLLTLIDKMRKKLQVYS